MGLVAKGSLNGVDGDGLARMDFKPQQASKQQQKKKRASNKALFDG
jgi:hypothetical protein